MRKFVFAICMTAALASAAGFIVENAARQVCCCPISTFAQHDLSDYRGSNGCR